MRSYRLSRAAKAALTDIYLYTHETWGAEQADSYLDGFYATFDRIAGGAELWRPIPADFEVGGYFTRYEKHFIYWKSFDDGGVGIVAVLHSAMLQGDRLREAFGPLRS